MVSVQFRKSFTGTAFCGGSTKKLQTFSRHFFWQQPSKYCIAEFTAIFAGLLLSWSRPCSMKWSSNHNFNNSWPLHLIFKNKINLCPYIWFIKNSKCLQFFFWKRSCQKKQFSVILKGCYFVMGSPSDTNVGVF